MSKLDNLSVNQKRNTVDSRARNIDIKNQFERASVNRNPNNMSVNNPRYQSNYAPNRHEEFY